MTTRREFVKKSVAVAVPTTVLGGMWCAKNLDYSLGYPLTDRDVEKARRHKEIRQEFWDLFLQQYSIKGCKRLVDDPEYPKFSDHKKVIDEKFSVSKHLYTDDKTDMARGYAPIEIVGRGMEVPIFIGTNLWDIKYRSGLYIFRNPELMASIIVDHEGTHTNDVSDGYVIGSENVINHSTLSNPYSSTFMEDLAESRAYHNHSRNMRARGFIGGPVFETVTHTCEHLGRLFFHAIENEDQHKRRYARLQLDAFPDIKFDQKSEKSVIVSLEYLGNGGKRAVHIAG